MPATRTLGPNSTLIVAGPAVVTLVEGDATVLAAPLQRGERHVISAQRQLPVLSGKSAASLEITHSARNPPRELPGNTIPHSWYQAADAITTSGAKTVLILGDVDTGKSTLSTFLVNIFLQRKVSVWMIDADIGQSDIGPPTTIGASDASTPIMGLYELQPSRLFFVGDTSPSENPKRVVEGITDLLRGIAPRLSIVNTDGWVQGREAIEYKLGLVKAVKPDLVLALQREDELIPALSLLEMVSLNLDVSQAAKPRTRTARRQVREASYRNYFHDATAHVLALKDVAVSRVTPPRKVLTPNELIDLRSRLRLEILYGDRNDTTTNLYAKGDRVRYRPRKTLGLYARIFPESQIRNSIVGLGSDHSRMTHLGILERIDIVKGRATVYGGLDQTPGVMEIGGLRLTRTGREIVARSFAPDSD